MLPKFCLYDNGVRASVPVATDTQEFFYPVRPRIAQKSSLSSSALPTVGLSTPPVPPMLSPREIQESPITRENNQPTVVVSESVASMPVSPNAADIQTPLKPSFAPKSEEANLASPLPDDANRDFEILDQLGSISARKPLIESPLRGNADPFNIQFAEQEQDLSREHNEKMRKILFAGNNPSLIGVVDPVSANNSTALSSHPLVVAASTAFSGGERGSASTIFSGVKGQSRSPRPSRSPHALTQLTRKWEESGEAGQATLPFVPSLASTRCSFINEQRQLTGPQQRDNSPPSPASTVASCIVGG